MTIKKFSLRRIRAIRNIRSGVATVDQVCEELRIPQESLRALEQACRTVPDELLAQVEGVLSDNERLRRLVADLLPDISRD
ncbi:MAG: hypothetical protein ABJB01_03070 [Rudaea sp.]